MISYGGENFVFPELVHDNLQTRTDAMQIRVENAYIYIIGIISSQN